MEFFINIRENIFIDDKCKINIKNILKEKKLIK